MPDNVSVGRIPLRRQFPALRILDSAGLALSPASIVIATITSVLLIFAGGLFDWVLSVNAPETANSPIARRWANVLQAISGAEIGAIQPLPDPWWNVVQPAVLLLTTEAGFNVWLNRLLRFALMLGVWSLVGVILCRRSAFLFVGNDESTVQRAIDYGVKRWPAAVCAPLIPLSAAFLMGLFLALAGLLGRMPFLGSWWLFATSPFATILGFAIAISLLATTFGWPLMVAAVSTDDCDSFGGLSRAYSGLTGRPWHAAGYLLFSLLVGIALTIVVTVVGETTIGCVMSVTTFGSGDEIARNSLLIPLTRLVHSLVAGVGISFFWSASTVIYLLLRQDVDGVPLDQIAADDDARPARVPLPVVGIPATDSRMESNGKVHSGNV